MSDSILVTGGAGFIGSHVVDRLLKLGRHVVCLDNFNEHYDPKLKRANISKQAEHQAYELVEGDVRDADLLDDLFAGREVGCVIHLASRAGVRSSVKNPRLYQDVNCGGTVNLLDACRRHDVESFIFGSTSSVYGATASVPFREDAQPGPPKSPYAASKRYAEHACRVYHERFGMKSIVLRFFTVYGPRGRPDMSVRIFTDRILRGEPLPLFGDGTITRDFTFVDDIVSGVVAATERVDAFEILNLGAGRPVSMLTLIELIEKYTGCKAQVRRLPSAAGDVPRTCADITRSVRVLGYRPEVMIEEGIKRFVEWYRKFLVES